MRHSQLRIYYSQKILSPPISCSGDSYRFFREIWDKHLINLQEQVYILFLNGANEVIGWRCLNTGTGSDTRFDLKLALSCALSCMASKIIIAHNHPSGVLQPSHNDLVITKRLAEGAVFLDIVLADHLIITRNGYYSFVDNNLIKT